MAPPPPQAQALEDEAQKVRAGGAAVGDGGVSIGPTAVMPAPSLTCDQCAKTNHLGVAACVFCGHPFAAAPVRAAQSGWASTGSSISIREVDEDEVPPSRRARTSIEELGGNAPIADPLIGVVVAERYRILDAIGRGGMGIVYKVEHTRIGKLLAMKLLTGELSRNPDVVRRFKQEALTASKLSSPNTVQVFDFGAAEGLTYLVMELVAGEDLGRVLRGGGPMPFSRLGKIMIQVCSSLAEAHQKGIVHRDIKPENVMLLRAPRDGTDIAKVLDFGLAKLREGPELNDVTSQGAIVGTPYFMAPEQVRGEAVDHRADIYALGALMYRALTGFYPFTGPTPMAVFTKHLTEAPVPPHERAPDRAIPPKVSEIVIRSLEKDPADRWQRVEDMQSALLEEIKAVSTTSSSSVETLLDSGQLRRLAKVAAEIEMQSMLGPAAPAVEIATRDELVAYERKLRRNKYTALGLAAVVALGAGGGGIKFALMNRAAFSGVEVEPNNAAAEAQPVPFGSRVSGYLGKRIDPHHADRDFYAFDVPRGAAGELALVRLSVTALPNFATCTFVYKPGFAQALGQYCVGIAGRDLEIPALALEPGKYLVAVTQDQDGYGGPQPPVYENVSDPYVLELAPATRDPGVEVEPNDQVASHNPVGVGQKLRASIGWARDEDVFCAAGAEGKEVRWKVADAVTRPPYEVLEATPIYGPDEREPVRVHVGTSQKPAGSDVASPWQSDALGDDGAARCLRVRLAPNPWSDARSAPRGGRDAYTVELEPAD